MQGETGFVFHHANAYDAPDRCVVVDAIRYPVLPDFHQACGSGRHFVQVCLYAKPWDCTAQVELSALACLGLCASEPHVPMSVSPH